MIDYVEARAIYYNLCRNRYDFSLFRIGREVNRNHASVMHGLKVYDNLMATDIRFRNKARLVEQYVMGGEVMPNEEHTPCDELVSENKRLKMLCSDKINEKFHPKTFCLNLHFLIVHIKY
jgi:hypothetical protein